MKLTKIVVLQTQKGEYARELAGKILTALGFITRNSTSEHAFSVESTWIELVDVRNLVRNKDMALYPEMMIATKEHVRKFQAHTNRQLAHVTAWKTARLSGDGLTLFVEDTCTLTDNLIPGIFDVPVNFDVCFVDGCFKYDGTKIPATVGMNPNIKPTELSSAYLITGKGLPKIIEHFTPLSCDILELAQFGMKGRYNLSNYAETQSSFSDYGVGRRDVIFATWHQCFTGLSREGFQDTLVEPVNLFPYEETIKETVHVTAEETSGPFD